ncbi:M48 family metalloprotease [Methylovirgula sp. 4M-Z18]|uniref:M48 family metalloprotease n=1 Tax=Methylovirgula sp. 4M-Z18 TaxID=2293567 RepID=UPI001FDF779B|nr:M48 family metalloprotease [Methylovirgula sp. 4M-Z18]
MPPQAPRATGVESEDAREHKRLVALFGGEYRDPTLEHYLNDMLGKLSAAASDQGLIYHVTVLNTPAVNAFALPSGNLYITRGLLALANDGSEVAAVMAHEIGHVTAKHASQRAELEKRSAVITKAAAVVQNKAKSEEVQVSQALTLASFSRLQELEADKIGVNVIGHAGYDPYGASRFLQSLDRSAALRSDMLGQKSGADNKMDIMATHPSTPERINRAIDEARMIGAPGTGSPDRDGFLNAINGMIYGDDPAEGYIRGTHFIHPKLGFAFVAPDGFNLENTARAVLGTNEDSTEALRLDSVRIPTTTSLESYMTAGWVDGLDKNSIETVTVNGLPAATAFATSGDWAFRIAAIRLGNDVYRLIFATRAMTPERAERFRASIDSFRRVNGEEAEKVKPLRITIVTATASDTVETLGSHMTIDRPVENFAIINEIEPGGELKAGSKYKLITE